ncbi:MAG: alpha/beta fold hydrolase [Ilumatobacteraceae bacterium]
MTATASAQVINDLPARARTRWHVDELVTHETTINGQRAVYGLGGRGLPVLFLHGWGLDHRAYQRSLRRLTNRGCRVLAPSMPGFGGSAALPPEQRTLDGYAAWVNELVEAVGITEPMIVLGHSFGGGVATKFAHDHPDRARYLVMVNSVGDPRAFVGNLMARVTDIRTWTSIDPALHMLLPTPTGATARLVPRIFVENVLRDARAVADAGRLAASADLAEEMATLAERGLPTLVLWSDADSVIPMTAFDTFCSTFGADGQVVSGGHSWLLANPDVFGQVLDNVVQMQAARDHADVASATTAQLRDLLRTTTLPERVSNRLLDGVSPLWAMSAAPSVLAGDLTLCHPRLETDEVRAVARRLRGTNTYRVTVVAHDRPGLLADTAAVLASEGASVISASATTWTAERMALHSLTVRSVVRLDQARWTAIGDRLREVATGATAPSPFTASGRVDVTVTGAGDGRSVVRITARDRIGLLSAVSRWFADERMSVEAANVTTHDGIAQDTFIVEGECDVDGLARALSGRRRCPLRAVLPFRV